MYIVGFVGQAGGGKDYAAGVFQELSLQNTRLYKFSNKLKAFCRDVFNWTEEHTDGALKEVPDINGVIPRVAMQTLGADWGRALFSDIWINQLLRQIREESYHTILPVSNCSTQSFYVRAVDVALITDVRFENEARRLKELSAVLVYVEGGSPATKHSEHISESGVPGLLSLCDYVIDNTAKDPEIMRSDIKELLKAIQE